MDRLAGEGAGGGRPDPAWEVPGPSADGAGEPLLLLMLLMLLFDVGVEDVVTTVELDADEVGADDVKLGLPLLFLLAVVVSAVNCSVNPFLFSCNGQRKKEI